MRILIIGDIIIDKYVRGSALGISAETPTIVAKFQKEEEFIGGAALVARHLTRLGNEVTVLSVVGEESSLRFRMSHRDIDNKCHLDELKLTYYDLIKHDGWKVSEKKRFFVDNYKLLQFDNLNEGMHNDETTEELLKRFKSKLDDCDKVIVCDNRHGVLDEIIAREIVHECCKRGKPLYVDSQVSQKISNMKWYAGCTTAFFNHKELFSFFDSPPSNLRVYLAVEAASNIAQNVILKRGENGSVKFIAKNLHAYTENSGYVVKDVVDTCGAGDAFLAAYVHSNDSMDFANRWAALSVMYVGTVVPKIEDLRLFDDGIIKKRGE